MIVIIIYSDAVVWTNLCICNPKRVKLEIGKGFAMVLIIAVAKNKHTALEYDFTTSAICLYMM